MQLDIALAPPGVLRSDRDQVSSLHIGVNTQVVRDINHEEVPVEELLEEVVLVEVDVDELNVCVLRNVLATEQAFKRLDFALGVVVCIGVCENNDGLLFCRVRVRRNFCVREFVQEVSMRWHHGNLVEEHGCLLEQRNIPVRSAQERNTTTPQLVRNSLRLLQFCLGELGFQEVD